MMMNSDLHILENTPGVVHALVKPNHGEVSNVNTGACTEHHNSKTDGHSLDGMIFAYPDNWMSDPPFLANTLHNSLVKYSACVVHGCLANWLEPCEAALHAHPNPEWDVNTAGNIEPKNVHVDNSEACHEPHLVLGETTIAGVPHKWPKDLTEEIHNEVGLGP